MNVSHVSLIGPDPRAAGAVSALPMPREHARRALAGSGHCTRLLRRTHPLIPGGIHRSPGPSGLDALRPAAGWEFVRDRRQVVTSQARRSAAGRPLSTLGPDPAALSLQLRTTSESASPALPRRHQQRPRARGGFARGSIRGDRTGGQNIERSQRRYDCDHRIRRFLRGAPEPARCLPCFPMCRRGPRRGIQGEMARRRSTPGPNPWAKRSGSPPS